MLIGQKKLWLTVTIVAILAALFVSYNFTRGNSKAFDPNVDLRTLSAEQQQDYWSKLAELYKKDTYGGKTPEETLQLFIDALKKGDTELAAKYFIPEKQKKEAEDLSILKSKGKIESLIGYLNNNQKGKLSENGSYYIPIVDKGNFLADIVFVLNRTNNIWKITDL